MMQSGRSAVSSTRTVVRSLSMSTFTNAQLRAIARGCTEAEVKGLIEVQLDLLMEFKPSVTAEELRQFPCSKELIIATLYRNLMYQCGQAATWSVLQNFADRLFAHFELRLNHDACMNVVVEMMSRYTDVNEALTEFSRLTIEQWKLLLQKPEWISVEDILAVNWLRTAEECSALKHALMEDKLSLSEATKRIKGSRIEKFGVRGLRLRQAFRHASLPELHSDNLKNGAELNIYLLLTEPDVGFTRSEAQQILGFCKKERLLIGIRTDTQILEEIVQALDKMTKDQRKKFGKALLKRNADTPEDVHEKAMKLYEEGVEFHYGRGNGNGP